MPGAPDEPSKTKLTARRWYLGVEKAVVGDPPRLLRFARNEIALGVGQRQADVAYAR